MATITHACGHTARISLSGTATSKSQQMHEATMQDCPHCAEEVQKQTEETAAMATQPLSDGLSPILAALVAADPSCGMTARQIAEATGLDIRAIVPALRGFVRSGLVRYTASPDSEIRVALTSQEATTMFEASDLEQHISDDFRITLPALDLLRRLMYIVGIARAAKIWTDAESAVMAEGRTCIEVADVKLAAEQEMPA